MVQNSTPFRAKVSAQKPVNDVIIANVIDCGAKSHRPAARRVLMTEHFTVIVKVAFGIGKREFRAIDRKTTVLIAPKFEFSDVFIKAVDEYSDALPVSKSKTGRE